MKKVILCGTGNGNMWRQETALRILDGHSVPAKAVIDPTVTLPDASAGEMIAEMATADVILFVIGNPMKQPGVGIGISFQDIAEAALALAVFPEKTVVALDTTHEFFPGIRLELEAYLKWLTGRFNGTAVFDDLETALHYVASLII
jgi:hypothetical protein